MSKTKIICPAYYQIVRYDGRDWYFKQSKKFYNPARVIVPSPLQDIDKLATFGTERAKLVMEFRLMNGGKIGYYLADLKDSKYYYCGLTLEDVKVTLQSLGIGRPDSVGS